MRTTASAAAIAAALMAASVSAEAQSGPLAVAPAAATGPFYSGQTFKAPQSCPRFPGDGITVTVRSVSEDGAAATVGVEVRCWGTVWLVNGLYQGSMRTSGTSATLTFLKSNSFGGEMRGTWQFDSGKPVFRFGESTLRAATNPLLTTGAEFR